MFCNYCGVANPDDSLFCKACGKRIANAAAPEATASVEPTAPRSPAAPPSPAPSTLTLPRNAPWWIALGAACLALLFFVRAERTEPAPSDVAPTVGAPAAPPQLAQAIPAVELAPPPPAAAPAPANSIVGRWKTSLLIGDGYLTFTADGRVHIEHVFTDEWCIYVFNDGDLMIQDQGFFDHDITHWQAQLSGDTLTVIEPEGASHIYTRVSNDGFSSDAPPSGGSETAELIGQILRGLASASSAQESATPESQAALQEFAAVVRDAVNGANAPTLNIEPAPSALWLEICAPASVVEKPSWSQRDSVGAQAIRDAFAQLLASHRFRDLSADEVSSGSAHRIVRVTETSLDRYQVAEVGDEASECSGDYETTFPVDLAAAHHDAASTSDGGFGDLIGEGGFIQPLPDN